MSLVEVLIASLLLASSSCAALRVWTQATKTWQQSSKLLRQADQLQLLQRASHRWLMLHGAEHDLVRSGSDSCRLNSQAIASAFERGLPVPSGITRHWAVDSRQLGLWQELSALNGDGEVLLQRRQLISAEAYGLCRS